jgi:hypothetical protein
MTTIVKEEPKSVMIDPNYRKNQERIAADEAELEELMKAEGAPKEEELEVTTEVVEEEVEDKTISREEGTFKKRYGDLRRHQQEQERKWEAKFAALEKKGPVGIAPPKSDEDIDAWAAKYPDVAGIVETIAAKKAKQMFEQTDSRFKELDDLNYETKKTKAETAIRASHTDFDTLRTADDFHDWVDEQPQWMKDALYENQEDASSVIRVIDLYKVDKGLTASTKKATAKDIASSVTSKGPVSIDDKGEGIKFSESQVMRESDAWYSKNEKAIMEAMASGNFVYDLTN